MYYLTFEPFGPFSANLVKMKPSTTVAGTLPIAAPNANKSTGTKNTNVFVGENVLNHPHLIIEAVLSKEYIYVMN